VTVRAAIFDRDGVLTRFDFQELVSKLSVSPHASFAELWRMWEEHLRAQAPPREAPAERVYVQRFWRKVVRAWELDEALERDLLAYDYTAAIRAYDDARPTLLEARARGLRIGVLSNFPFLGLDASLSAAGLRDLVDVTIAAGVEGTPKPRPQAYRSALAALGVSAAECVLVDDEDECVRGASAVGIRAYRLDRHAQRAEAHVLARLGDVLPILDSMEELPQA
jgi:putative hydrolase of the HAD superfamily